MKKKYKILMLFLVVLIFVFIGLSFLFNKKEKLVDINFESRIDEINKFQTDAYKVGWIQVQGTNIDLPVLDYTTYLGDDVDYEYAWVANYFSKGMNRRVINAHNLLNVSPTPTKDVTNLRGFEALMAYVYYDYASENLYFQFTDYETQEEEIYKIYAIGFYDYNDYVLMGFDNKESVNKYIDMVLENSVYDYDVDVNSSDKLITLVTCTRFFGSSTKQQIFVDARKVRNNEEIVKYSVKKTKLFNEYKLFD